jgi:predicted component of type VI protein secretion system
MKNLKKYFLALLVMSFVVASSGCSSAKKNNCGCPNKKGMIGY